MKKFITLTISFIILFTSLFIPKNAKAKEVKELNKNNEKIVSTYVPLYQYWRAEDIKGDKLTDVLIAFAQLDKNYRLYFPEEYPTKINEAKRLKELYPNLRVSLSIGGWGAEGFSEMVASYELRKLFVEDCVKLIKEYNLDGIDIDWESPVGGSWLPEEEKNWADKENFTKLMRDLRAAFDDLKKENNKEYILSYATSPAEWAITNLEYKEVFNLVDRINLMCYAYEGSWSGKTGHASNLYYYKESQWGVNTAASIKTMLQYGVPSEKLILGVPAFSQEWYGVKNENNGLGQPFKGTNNLNMSFVELKKNYINKNGFKRYWDDFAKQPYLYNGDMFISYEDEESIKVKMDYIKDNRLGGVMMWQYFQDDETDLLDASIENLK